MSTKIGSLVKKYCTEIDVKLIFESCKVGSLFSVKDKTSKIHQSNGVYQYTCDSCYATYIGETRHHFSTRVNEHLLTDKRSAIFKHLQGSSACKAMCGVDSFKGLDRTETKFKLNIKEVLYIKNLTLF